VDVETPLPRGSATQLGSKMARGSLIGVGVRLARVAITLVGTAFLARLLTPADFGVFALSTVLVTLGFVLAEGLVDVPVLRYDHLTMRHVRSLTWFTVVALVAISLVAVALSPLLSPALDIDDFGTVVLLTVPAVLAQPFIVAAIAVLRRTHQFRTAFLASLAAPVIFNVVAIPMAFADLGMYSLVGAQAVSFVANAVLVCILAGTVLLPPKRADFGGTLGSASSGSSSRLLLWVTTNADTFAVAGLYGPNDVGVYSRAYNINVQLKEPFTIVDTMSRQTLTAMRTSGTLTLTNIGHAFRMLTCLSALVAGAVILASDGLVRVLLGPQWEASAWLLAILALGLPGRVGGNFLDGLAISAGTMSSVLWRAIITTVATLGALAALAHLGLSWVAVAVTAGIYVGLVVRVRERRSEFSLPMGLRLRLFAPAAAITAGYLTAYAALESQGWADAPAVLQVLVSAAVTTSITALALVGVPRSWIPVNGVPRPGLGRLVWIVEIVRHRRKGSAP
jgi:O-antigen/teichoic acid export membrane protein